MQKSNGSRFNLNVRNEKACDMNKMRDQPFLDNFTCFKAPVKRRPKTKKVDLINDQEIEDLLMQI